MSDQTVEPSPEEQAVLAEFERLGPWYHTITHPSGLESPGKGANILRKFNRMEPWLEEGLEGKRVLDVGANAGGLSIEFAKRGAHATAMEVSEHYAKQARWMSEEHGLSMTVLRKNVYQLSEIDETYDFVLFMGLIYHLRHPQLAVDLLASRCKGRVFLNTPTVAVDLSVMECRLPAEWRHKDADDRVPAIRDPMYNWWYPSTKAMMDMMRAAGFYNIEVIHEVGGGFRSSSDYVDNASAYPTGQLWLTAECKGNRDVLIDMAR